MFVIQNILLCSIATSVEITRGVERANGERYWQVRELAGKTQK